MTINELRTALRKLKLHKDSDIWINGVDGQPRELYSVTQADFGRVALLTRGKKIEFYVIPTTEATRRRG